MVHQVVTAHKCMYEAKLKCVVQGVLKLRCAGAVYLHSIDCRSDILHAMASWFELGGAALRRHWRGRSLALGVYDTVVLRVCIVICL